jgi:hypothetical protein
MTSGVTSPNQRNYPYVQKENQVNRSFAFLLFACSVVCLAQTPLLKGGSTVYIEPMGGYETYLAAAMVKKHVPLVVVTDKDKADYIIHSTIDHVQPNQSQAEVVINNSNTVETNNNPNQSAFDQGFASGQAAAARRAAYKASLGYSTASIAVIDPQSSQIAFSYSVEKDGKNQLQKTAEDYAKHLKEFIEKSEKHSKK